MVLVDNWRCQQKTGRDPRSDQVSAVSCQPERAAPKSVTYVPEQMLPYVAVRGQPKTIGANQIQNPHLPRFPAYGVFLLKRPKGTKSRRWARRLLYAWREFPHWTHPIHWPANHGGYRSLQGDGKARPALEVLAIDVASINGVASRGRAAIKRPAVS